MRIAKTFVRIVVLMTPLMACADVPKQALAERDLEIAVARTHEVRLAPHVPNFLWFRFSWGHYEPTRPEFVVSLRYEPAESEKSPPKIAATLVEIAEPIVRQISAFLRENPSAPTEAAIRAVAVERYEYREETCPAVHEISAGFRQSSATAFAREMDFAGFYHGELLQVEGHTGDMFFSLFVEEGNPMFQWGIEAAASLKRCPSH